ncbi:hypothetical protein SAMN04488505_1021102 [Chitinophaga rupis]|uniref:Copper chaperone CopZ n=1 Tax=Chitinophaga rupis TaxID=573321 RepID=A0A1H7T1U5_9BACT|nr:hypothetical protein [Chitinophaga rupis]SEL78246.1 hypothetical protein SAMN04488505_1021102 [Chitinophaga rupis]
MYTPVFNMVEVFKTNVQQAAHAEKLVSVLHQHFPGNKVNFDLEDCDRILRVEGQSFAAEKIQTLVTAYGFTCHVLE